MISLSVQVRPVLQANPVTSAQAPPNPQLQQPLQTPFSQPQMVGGAFPQQTFVQPITSQVQPIDAAMEDVLICPSLQPMAHPMTHPMSQPMTHPMAQPVTSQLAIYHSPNQYLQPQQPFPQQPGQVRGQCNRI